SSVNLKIRNETFVNAGDSDATKLTLGFGNILFLNKNKTQAGIFDLAYTSNNANADISKYTKVDISALYLTPWIWETQVIAGVALYMQSYPFQNPTRDDTNLTASLTLARPILDWLKVM